LLTKSASSGGACGKSGQGEGGREKHLLHDHYPLRIEEATGPALGLLLGGIRGAPKRALIGAIGMEFQHGF